MASQKKLAATILVSDGAGGMRELSDHRFDVAHWPINASIPAAHAHDYLAHLRAECGARSWSSAQMSQLDPDENSGSMTIGLAPGQNVPTILIAWEKVRGGDLHFSAKPGGTPETPLSTVQEFLATVADRLKQKRLDRQHRRGWLTYFGRRWAGELWLNTSLRLGPPSRVPNSIYGPQALIIDAWVEGIGVEGVVEQFDRLRRELRLVLSPILGIHLQSEQSEYQWTQDINAATGEVDCVLRQVGYVENGLPPAFPNLGAAPTILRQLIQRPNLDRAITGISESQIAVPQDVEDLWRAFTILPADLQQQFLNSCNAYSIAQSMWPSQQTAYAAFHVVACEALKPPGKKFKDANIYDVVTSLIDSALAAKLYKLRMRPQTVRSQHLHHGSLLADELSLIFGDPFRDPSFRETIDQLSITTRACIIEWLRRSGRYQLKWFPRGHAQGKASKLSQRRRTQAKNRP